MKKAHGKNFARQRGRNAHGKEVMHGKENWKHTAKNFARQRHCRLHSFAVRGVRLHGKGTFAVRFAFAVRLVAFSSFPFLLYLF